MADGDAGSGLDLNAILVARWADPAVFPAVEFMRASEFYRQRRDRDRELLAVRKNAASLIREWTGRHSRDVGSFGLRLNLETSDLDLGIGYPVEQREALIALLAPNTALKGERVTRFPAADHQGSEPATTTRLVFAFEVEGVDQVPQGSAALINRQESASAQRVYSLDSSSASVPCKTGAISITVPAMRARSRLRRAFIIAMSCGSRPAESCRSIG